MIVQNEPVTGSPFGAAFADFVQDWRQIVTTDNPNGVEVEFTVPLSSLPNQEVSISRIGILASGTHAMKARVLHSTDNVNYTRFPGIDEQVLVTPGKLASLDFETTRVQFVRFVFSMSEPTVVEGNSYGYVFSIRNISFSKLGRSEIAELISKPLTPTGLDSVDKVSL